MPLTHAKWPYHTQNHSQYGCRMKWGKKVWNEVLYLYQYHFKSTGTGIILFFQPYPHLTYACLLPQNCCSPSHMHNHTLYVWMLPFKTTMCSYSMSPSLSVWFAPKHFTHLNYPSTKNNAAGFHNKPSEKTENVPGSQYGILSRTNNVLYINICCSQIW